jgi:WD40 repeat protein
MIVDLCEINELNLIVSASLDDTINLYSIENLKLWGTLIGHKKGVRRLAFGHDLLFSCGYEFVVKGWSIDVDETGDKSASGELCLELNAHEVMLLDIKIVPVSGIERVISADISGRFILWDVGANAKFSGHGNVLQEFTAGYGFTSSIRTFFVSRECSSGPPIAGGKEASIDDTDEDDKDGGSGSGSSICTLVAGANDIIRFALVNTHTKKVDVPSNVLFNPNTLQFFTLAGNDIHIWDASDGRHVHSFWNIFEKSGKAENIECMCFDTRRRKIIAGSEGGHVFVFNSVSGASMKGIKAHMDAVVSVAYTDRSRCIVTSGNDRRVCIFDESGSDTLFLLRSVSHLHIRGIECCAFSEELSQIATGSTSGSLKMIDFERLRLTSDCVQRRPTVKEKIKIAGGDHHHHHGNITALEFAPKNRPILISLDTNGTICVWKGKKGCFSLLQAVFFDFH